MDNSFHKKKSHELVLYQAIINHSRQVGRPVEFRGNSVYPRITSIPPLKIKPGVKRVVEKITRQVFYQNDWWSTIHSDKGLIIDLHI